MNLSFLGDALDHWKGSLFESLQKRRIVCEFAVDPMASDLVDWKPGDFAILSKLLRIDRSQIISHNRSLNDRRAYLLQAGLLRFERFLLEDDSPGGSWGLGDVLNKLY